MPYLSALEVCSRQGAIQIHVYLYLYITFTSMLLRLWYRRPYFTVWVTSVQIIIFIVTVSVHGIAPIGVRNSHSRQVVSANGKVALLLLHRS